eukprot:4753246-Pleurochrysis_carterae.AAC.1
MSIEFEVRDRLLVTRSYRNYKERLAITTVLASEPCRRRPIQGDDPARVDGRRRGALFSGRTHSHSHRFAQMRGILDFGNRLEIKRLLCLGSGENRRWYRGCAVARLGDDEGDVVISDGEGVSLRDALAR